jgi:sugar (pentulose or hexulose) kinase
LQPGIPFCPPEGDAGTGMVATNSIAERTGNVSAGTSVFAMIVLEKELSRVYPEIDMVATPTGKHVAMVHCNNCTSDIDAWVKMFGELANLDKTALYNLLYNKALEGEPDCGGLVSCNYCSGEHITGFEEGRPLFTRMPDSRLTLANFMRNMLYSAMASLKLGMNILTERENVRVEKLLGHGGLFKVKGAAQKLMAGALNVPVAVMETAGEGGPWGMALLAAYLIRKRDGETLDEYLENRVFGADKAVCVEPAGEDIRGFAEYMKRYQSVFAVERSAVENFM